MKTTLSDPGTRNFFLFRIFNRLRQAWTTIINIGVSPGMERTLRKRIRLLNGICAMGVIAQTWFVCTYTAPEERYVFFEALQAALFYLLPILFNHLHRHNQAFHIFSIYNLFCYSAFAITHGEVDGAEYFLLPSGMAAMLFFSSYRVIFTYFILNLVFFWLCKYSFTVMEPIIVLPFNTYIPNQTFLFLVSFLIVLYFKTENTRQENALQLHNEELEAEKQKSDSLLLNILPYETAEELKATGKARPKYFDQVTVLFTDFHNFTEITEKMHPELLVSEINTYFSEFDTIIGKYGIEKIKTIGDSYMCASGLPKPNKNHALDMIAAALEINSFIEQRKRERLDLNLPFFESRIGIHTGPIVAGIVGLRKFAYDIWGDTVNLASRMEASGELGRINISGTVYEQIRDHYLCTYRGKLSVKSKGLVDMYFVEGKVPEFRVGGLRSKV